MSIRPFLLCECFGDDRVVRVYLELVARDAGRAIKRGDVVVVVDVLRCTSSIITALANGARRVLPLRTVEEARRIHEDNPSYILAGERRGVKPEGFALGNSPLAFTEERVSGRDIILTTTSGTETLLRARGGRYVLVGALLNARFVAEIAFEIAEKEGCGISLVLSGKRGSFSLEDFLGAGAIIEGLPKGGIEYSDAAYASSLVFKKARGSLTTIIQRGNHAKALKSLGFEKDVVFCSQLNKYKIVPILKGGVIVPLASL